MDPASTADPAPAAETPFGDLTLDELQIVLEDDLDPEVSRKTESADEEPVPTRAAAQLTSSLGADRSQPEPHFSPRRQDHEGLVVEPAPAKLTDDELDAELAGELETWSRRSAL